MALEVELPFVTVQLEQEGGAIVLQAPLFPEIGLLGGAPESLARAFEGAVRRGASASDDLLPWLSLASPLDYEVERLEVELETGRQVDLPERVCLPFDILVAQTPAGDVQGHVPALGVDAVGADRDRLRAALTEAIHLYGVREGAFSEATGVLATQWFAAVDIVTTPVTVGFLTFAERREARTEVRESILSRSTRPLSPPPLVVGVDGLLEQLEPTVRSRRSPSVLLVGPSGVGKSALIGELARRSDDTWWRASAPGLERTLTDSEGWQANLRQLCAELEEDGGVLVVDNLAELFEVGRYEGNPTSMAEGLRPLLGRARLRLVTECTPEQAARIDARWPGYLDVFTRVDISEPADLIGILRHRARRIRTGASVLSSAPLAQEDPDGGLDTVLRLFHRFAPYSGMPGRAVRFVEGSLRSMRKAAQSSSTPAEPVPPLCRATVLEHFCADSGMPRLLVDPSLSMPTDELRRWFEERVYGQPAAVDSLVHTITAVRAAMTRPRRPIATLLFAGPTGVGKTESARALATWMFGGPDRMVRFDMSEYSTPAAALRLTEGPGGDGRLTGAVRREPFCVLLLDEVEKAHPMVFDLLLQLLGEGRLSDGRGRTVDFCSTIVILTSNLGAREAARLSTGFGRTSVGDLQARYAEAVKKSFRPELVNRLDRIVAFAPLASEAIAAILDRELAALADSAGLRQRRLALEVSPDARARLVREGTDPAWGARHLQRALRRQLAAPLARAIGAADSISEGTARVELENERLTVGISAQSTRETDPLRILAEHAEQATRTRRTALAVEGASAHAEVKSWVAILEREQRRRGRDFWTRGEESAQLARARDLLERLRRHREACVALSWQADTAFLERSVEGLPTELELDELRTQGRLLRRELAGEAEETSEVMVGVYGKESLCCALVQQLEDALTTLGFETERRELRFASLGGPFAVQVADPSSQHYGSHHLDPVTGERMTAASEYAWIGCELRVAGVAGEHALAELPGTWLWDLRDRLVVHRWTIGWTGLATARPTNLHRRVAFDEKVTHRVNKGRVSMGRTDQLLWSSTEALTAYLEDRIDAWCLTATTC